jgi:isocitrate lyase
MDGIARISTHHQIHYTLIHNVHGKGGYLHTFGALDPVQVVQMTPHLSSILRIIVAVMMLYSN